MLLADVRATCLAERHKACVGRRLGKVCEHATNDTLQHFRLPPRTPDQHVAPRAAVNRRATCRPAVTCG